jgi:putative membrane protein
MMGGEMIGGFGLAGGLIGMLFNIIIIVGIVVLIVWAVQKFSPSSSQSSPTSSSDQPLSAREILDIRYAKGELTRDEYQTKLNDIFVEMGKT